MDLRNTKVEQYRNGEMTAKEMAKANDAIKTYYAEKENSPSTEKSDYTSEL